MHAYVHQFNALHATIAILVLLILAEPQYEWLTTTM